MAWLVRLVEQNGRRVVTGGCPVVRVDGLPFHGVAAIIDPPLIDRSTPFEVPVYPILIPVPVAPTPSPNFLGLGVSDWISVGGTALTLLGLAIAVLQFRKQATAAKAAREATTDLIREVQRRHHAHVAANIRRYFDVLKNHVDFARWEQAVMRAADLAEQLAQVLSAREDKGLADAIAKLDEWEADLRRQTLKGGAMSPRKRNQWLNFCVELASAMDVRAGPFDDLSADLRTER